ncbi:MAG: UDP-N-acetylmuramoyl-tripeptide--D-alanyl-D-alanine ligase [Bacteroidetes bacterium]|nr:UDP-N-acetylmuramoyl-tripeptide--D-alanyl-D-alanine ligase [Bacteroidota bacterium]
MSIENLYEIYLRHPSIVTDTRLLKQGDLFFALKGPNFNGNTFAARAFELGAAYVVIDETPAELPPPAVSDRLIMVGDVLTTLQKLALHHRKQFNIPFIAITGSNGKTTTKELVHTVLASTYRTYTTKGNLNNHIGIPLTILSVRPDAEFAVIEMGANHQKEIEGYCRYTLPTHGIITNIGKAHLEGFGGPEGVKKGKGELYDYLRENGGTAFVLTDSADLKQMSRGIAHVITYGTHDADYTGVAQKGGSFLNVEILHGATPSVIHTQLVGDYNLPNVLVAVAVGKHFDVTDAHIHRSIEQYAPSNSRSQMIERDSNHIILDAYNANPSSMRAAIENFSKFPGDKVLILGAMAELGPESRNEHQAIVDLIAQYPWKQVVLVGGDFQKIDHPYTRFADSKEASSWFTAAGLHDTYILVKGSRSSKMEQVLA